MRAVLLSGGLTHDFPATTNCLAELLADQGFTAEIHTDVNVALDALPHAALLVVNALRWTMTNPGTPDRYRVLAETHGARVSPAARKRLAEHLRSGGGVLGMHTAAICFDDWPEWGQALGGRWAWGHSHHPPIGAAVHVRVVGAHPIVAGLGDFSITDEVYSDLVIEADVEPLLAAPHPGAHSPCFPLLWAREHGGGRIVYDALGHHEASYRVPEHREIVRRAIDWLRPR